MVHRAQNADWVKNLNRKEVLVLDEEVLRKCKFTDCCHAIPGDDVMGYVTEDNQLEIHKRSCETAVKLKTRFGNNIIACKWDTHKVMLYDVDIQFRGVDSPGVLYSIAEVLRKLSHFSVKSLHIDANDGIFEGKLVLSVYDTEDVQQVCDNLKNVENVTEAVRV